MAMRTPEPPKKTPVRGRPSDKSGQYKVVGPRDSGSFNERTTGRGKALAGSVLSQSGKELPRTTLKKAGGSLMVTVPAAARDALHLLPGQEMTVAVDRGRLVFEPAKTVPKYTLDELLAQCDFDAPYTAEEREWIDAPPVGRELL